MTYLSGRDQRRTPRRQAAHGLRARLLLLISLTAVASLALGGNAVHANPRSVAAYSFDEGSGATVSDSAGGHNGTIEGATWTTSGKYGSALSFDGEDDLVSIADAADLDLTGSFTLEAWVRPEALPKWRPVLGKGESLEAGGSGYLLAAKAYSKPGGFLNNGGASANVQGETDLPTNEWSHLAFTSDSIDLGFYVDGELVATKAAISVPATAAPLEIGRSELWGTHFNGQIDEVRIYDEALSADQIQHDRDTAVGLDQLPVAAYSFDEGSGTTLGDSAGDHDGTIEGATWTSNGKYGSALDFDGVDDLVSIPDAAALDFTDSFTLEAWVQPDSEANWRSVISKGESIEEGNAGYLLLARNGEGRPTGYSAVPGGTKSVVAPSALPAELWSHLAFTSDGTTMRLYVDGEQVASAEAAVAQATSASLEIGHWSLLNTFFDGLIDEVRIYDEPLSETRLQTDRDTRVEPPPPTEVTTTALDTGPSSELVESVPITNPGGPDQETVIYSLEVPSITEGEVLRVTANLEVTNKHSYAVTDSVQLVLGSNPSDGAGTIISPWARVQHKADMLHWTLPLHGLYRVPASLEGTQYLKVVFKAASASGESGDTLIVQPNFGRLTATRYTPAVGPMSQPTHELQTLNDSIPELTTSVPVDSSWHRVLTRKVGDLSANDILDITGQMEVHNTSGTLVEVESMIKMSTGPNTAGNTGSPVTADHVTSDFDFYRLVHTNQLTIRDPAKPYINLLVRAVPAGESAPPLTITAGSPMLNVLRMRPRPGDPTAPLREGTFQVRHGDLDPNVSEIPYAVGGGSEKQVVASAPLWGGLWKGEVLRGRGLVTSDLNGTSEVTQVLTQLILGDSPTDTTGDVVATLSGDKLPPTLQIHTSIKEGAYIIPAAEPVNKYLNYVVYASQTNPSGSMTVPSASVSYTRSKPTAPIDEGFETGLDTDGIDSVSEYEYNGALSASSAIEAREGDKSLLVDLHLEHDFPGDDEAGEIRRNEARPPDTRSAGGYLGEESWHGFSVYFPTGFDAPSPAPPAHFNGLMDEVRLYDQALTQEQVEQDGDGAYGSTPSPVAAFDFNEGEGNVANDISGNHDGEIDGPAWIASGKYGSALSFDGVNDIVRVADSPSLDFTEAFTLEAWVLPTELTNAVPVIRKSEFLTGYGLLPGHMSGGVQRPIAFAGDSEGSSLVSGESAISTTSWTHLAFSSDGTTLRLYVDGELVGTESATNASPTDADLTIGGPSLAPGPTAGPWNYFSQFHHFSSENPILGCPGNPGGVPISFNVRHYKAGAHTNPGDAETATPTEGDYIEVQFRSGEIDENCEAVNDTQRHVLAPLEHDRWYDFVLHTRWTPLEGGPGNSVSEVWVDGQQVLGDESTPISMPTLSWRGTPDTHNNSAYWQFGLYRGPSLEDPPVKLYIDAVRSGDSYAEVAPGQ